MSKLIYALTKAKFITAYTDWSSTSSAIYRSVGFTADGYLYSHGKFFRILPDAASIFTSTTNNGIATLKDSNNTSLGTIDVGVTAVVGGNALTSGTLENGSITIDHDASGVTAGSYGPTAISSDSISVPYITVDTYGHITIADSKTATLNNVQANVASTVFYLLGHTASTAGTATAVKISSIYGDASGNLTASKFIGSLNYNLSTTLNGGTAVVFDNTANKTLSFYAPTTAGTSGQVLQSTGGAPGWASLVSVSTGGITNGSSDTAIPSAAAVYNLVNTGIAANNAMIYKGAIDASTSPNYPAANAGDTYKISVAGIIGGASGIAVEAGDTIICTTDGTVAGTQAAVGSNWDVLQTNIVGAIVSASAPAAGTLLLGTGTQAITSLANSSAGNILICGGGTTNPSWTAPGSFTIQTNGTALGTAYSPTVSKTLNFIAGSNVTLSPNTTSITISSANTASANDGILHGTNPSGTAILYAPYSSQQASLLSFDTSSTNPVLTTRLNLNGNLWATTLYSGGVQVLTSHQAISTLTVNQYVGTTTTRITLFNPTNSADTLQFTQGSGIALSTTADSGIMTISHGSTGTGSTISDNRYVTGIDVFGHITSSSAFSSLTLSTPTNSGVDGAGNATRTTLAYDPSGAKTFNIIAGNNVNLLTSSNTLTISSTDTNTWRGIQAYFLSNNTLSSIGQNTLKFGSEFFWDDTNLEIKLGWAEIDENGAITYVV